MTRFAAAAEPRMRAALAALALASCFLLAHGCDATKQTPPLPPKGDRNRRTSPVLETEADVEKYLAERGKDVAILRCKSPVTIQWMTAVVPYVDLECEVLGSVRSIQWFYGQRALDTEPGRRYASTVRPHVKHGKYFARWLDYTLRIHRATEDDNGEYTLRVGGAGGGGLEGEQRDERHRIRLQVTTDYQPPKGVREQTEEKQSNAQKKARQRKKKSQRGKQRRSADWLFWA